MKTYPTRDPYLHPEASEIQILPLCCLAGSNTETIGDDDDDIDWD